MDHTIEQNKLKEIFEESVNFFYQLQDRITQTLEELEQEKCFYLPYLNKKNLQQFFKEDLWDYTESSTMLTGGGGRSRIIENGKIFEKGGVNVSDVRGIFNEEFSKTMPGNARRFRASGISLVLHPQNPYVPTVHANFRIIKKMTENGFIEKMWFGGGADLTPYLLYEEDAKYFHSIWKKVCDKYKPYINYEELKKECDNYFYLPHRKEHRGIGGIFFDYLDTNLEIIKNFVFDAGNHFLESYLPIVKKRMTIPYSNIEKEYQCYRRSRYVEFNLIYDRGTLFGLKTGGRIESIFMSLPSIVFWKYNYNPLEDNTIPEEIRTRISNLYKVIKTPKDWTVE
ncbi:MAG: oxygen-dependent coproporphyrinogen-III oxidase [Leptospiraceae bacterium]|nr:MAG: oxygen-dependent coproporphyrinogen-III oxidase [Leptospiraceae bacterium]